jgi:hypothetical protein
MDTSQLTVAKLVLPAFGAAGLYGAYRLVALILKPSALFDLPGPPAPGLLSAHFGVVSDAEHVEEHERLRAQYGHVARYYGIFGVRAPAVVPASAVAYTLTHL